ncbi:hypothetical protein JN535_04145 [Cellulosimicrobium cellulans]|uniref:hypothetical protein n=1 Tax=Cellulosimicrobium cellulans TaxID=1710 RepID=UPI0019666647|nr:hypothetical protein [Cellulosimicrobium cellulans]MBN0039365.1 hypothetical protein [Cellulosimicrobium cellulans]
MTTTLPAPTTRPDIVLPRKCGRTPASWLPSWPMEPLAPTLADLDVVLGHVLIGAELDAIRDDVAGMRDDFDEIRAAARVEEFLASIETSLYLTTALEYELTEDDVVAIAARALHLGRPGGIARPDEALDLALAALRGWAHRQALAAGGAR